MKRSSRYLSVAAITIGILALSAVAIAGTGGSRADARQKAGHRVTSSAEDQRRPEETHPRTEAELRPNHGHCVSFWRHQAKAQGLDPKARPSFIAMIAQDETAVTQRVERGGTPDATCDFQAELDAALQAQLAEGTPDHGRNAEAHGRNDQGHSRNDPGHGRNDLGHGG